MDTPVSIWNLYYYKWYITNEETVALSEWAINNYCEIIPSKVGGCWPGRSSSVVDPVVSSHTRQCGHFTVCTKKQKKQNKTNINQITNRGWKEETNKHGPRTVKLRKWSLALLCFLVCISYGQRENSAKVIHCYQKCWLIWLSSSLLCVLTPYSGLTTSLLRTDHFGVSHLTD